MSTINDLKAKSLRALGYTGSIDDMYRSYLRAISGSSLNSVDDLEKLVLGGSGSINDRWKAHLDISGIRGRAMDNMLREYWSTLGAGALGTAYLFRNNEVGVWYDPSDFSTMFQDSAGTTPVTAVGDPVGLVLDKSRGLVLGSELVTNGGFHSAITGWGDVGAWTGGSAVWSAGAIEVTVVTYQGAAQNISGLTIGKTYKITYDVVAVGSGKTGRLYVGPVDNPGLSPIINRNNLSVGSYVGIFTATATIHSIGLSSTSGDGVITWDNISVRELPGYHATQSTSTARPVLQQDSNGKYYLAFDGTDDFLVTSTINFSGTDKMSVFAGVRKLSDAATGLVAELSANVNSNAGTFFIAAPENTAASGDFSFKARGSINPAGNAFSGAMIAPVTKVITGLGDISGDSQVLRVNGAQVGAAVFDLGTGNYGAAYPLYIGMRAGTSLPFNGHLYSLVVRGALSDAAQIAAAESYVNSKTAAY